MSDSDTTARGASDDAITSSGEDSYQRAGFARMVAAQIDSRRVGESSTVFGLVGPWGGGKTSLLNLVRESLGHWKIVEFSPWVASDSAGVTAEFVSALSSAWNSDAGGNSADIRAKLVLYAKFGTPLLSMIPIFGSAAKELAAQGLDALSAPQPWHEAFAELSQSLAEQGERVLVVADDIDRLDPEELLTVLKVVRLLGRFTNVHYLLAYDQETIEDLLQSKGVEGRTSAFMEKIVQFPLEIPPLARSTRRKVLSTTFAELSVYTAWDRDEERTQRTGDLIEVITSGLTTPRELSRFHNQLFAYADMLTFDEIDLLDYAAISYLRLFHHDLWSELERWEDDLVSTGRVIPTPSDDTQTEGTWRRRIEHRSRPKTAKTALGALSFLFPSVKQAGVSLHTEHPFGAVSSKFFHRYLIMGIGEHDISNATVRNALVQLRAGEEDSSQIDALSRVLDSEDPELAILGYEKLSDEEQNDTPATSLAMLRFLHTRSVARAGDDTDFSSPAYLLQQRLAREVLFAIESSAASVDDVVSMFGEDTTFRLLFRIARSPEFRERAHTIALRFAQYFIAAMKEDYDGALKQENRVSTIVNLAVFAMGADNVTGLLDEFVGEDLDRYLRTIDGFVILKKWVGSGVHYEISFSHEFFTAVSEPLRRHFADLLPAGRPSGAFETDDLESRDIPHADRRDYGLQAVRNFDRAIADDAGAAGEAL